MSDHLPPDLPTALLAWREELRGREVLLEAEQEELARRVTVTAQRLLRQGYPMAEAVALATETAGGAHGDALAALWRLRDLARWEVIAWGIVGVVGGLVYSLLSKLVYLILAGSLDWPLTDGLPPRNANWYRMTCLVLLPLLCAGFSQRAFVTPERSRFFWLLRWMRSDVIWTASLGMVVGCADLFLYQLMETRNTYQGETGWGLFLMLAHNFPLLGLGILVHVKLRGHSAANSALSSVKHGPQHADWQRMLAGLLCWWMIGVCAGMTSSLLFYFSNLLGSSIGTWIRWYGLIQIIMQVSGLFAAWYLLQVPLLQRIAGWFLQRPGRFLVSAMMLILLTQFVIPVAASLAMGGGGGISWGTILAHSAFLGPLLLELLAWPVLLLLWIQWAAQRERSAR